VAEASQWRAEADAAAEEMAAQLATAQAARTRRLPSIHLRAV
jgi:hypothetical protein